MMIEDENKLNYCLGDDITTYFLIYLYLINSFKSYLIIYILYFASLGDQTLIIIVFSSLRFGEYLFDAYKRNNRNLLPETLRTTKMKKKQMINCLVFLRPKINSFSTLNIVIQLI